MPSRSINGTNSSRRQSGRSTCCAHANSTRNCQPTLTWRATATTIVSPSSPWDGTPWYLKTQSEEHRGPTMESRVLQLGQPLHYRCTTCWIPSTGAERISDTIMMFPPVHMTLPILPTP
ncbi:hypothetical protein ACHAWF_005043 [Thalassiosira exigua]